MNLQEAQEKHNVASMKAIEIIQQYQAGLILLDEFVAAIAKLSCRRRTSLAWLTSPLASVWVSPLTNQPRADPPRSARTLKE